MCFFDEKYKKQVGPGRAGTGRVEIKWIANFRLWPSSSALKKIYSIELLKNVFEIFDPFIPDLSKLQLKYPINVLKYMSRTTTFFVLT
jgi:hypothetical protein